MNQTVNVPLGPNAATVQVLDQYGNDITGTCAITASSSGPAVVVGSPAGGDPDTIPLTDAQAGQSAQVTYNAVNSAGQIEEVDTLNVVVPAPATINVTYQNTVVAPPVPAAAPAKS